MKRQRKRGLRALAVGAAAVSGALVLAGCGSNNNSSGGSTSASASGISCKGKGSLLASGSTAQQNAMNTWIKNYMQACPDTTINYKGVGSGAGITEFLAGSTAFAGSDSPLSAAQISQSKSVCPGGQGIDLPMVGGPIALVYNLPSVKNLVLDAPTVAQIFNSKITKWNDPAIAKLNPGVKLPNLAIQPYHRTEDSGTTDNFTKYLIATAHSDWPYSGGKSWQAKGGQSATGSAGVAAGVKQTTGAIAYDEYSYATSNQLQTVKLDTGASAPVAISTDAASKAIADAKVAGIAPDLGLKINYNTTAPGAWPIVLVTSEIVCSKGNKAATLEATQSFLNYIVSDNAQQELASQGYAPLPPSIQAKVKAAIAALS